jgi:hypothetical protein
MGAVGDGNQGSYHKNQRNAHPDDPCNSEVYTSGLKILKIK